MAQKRIALVFDWLTNMGGAEKLLLSFHKAFPDAPIYTSVFDPKTCPEFASLDVRTTFMQKLPRFLRNRHQLFPLLRPHAFRSLKLDEFDTVISITTAEAKAVRARNSTVHICYCNTPTRYYWSHYEEYKRQPGLGLLNPLARLFLPLFVEWMRRLDLKAVEGVNHFIANSSEVANRISTYYHRPSQVVYPPVLMGRFRHLDISGPRKGFVIVGRQVPYKRIDIAIDACNRLKLPLTVYGNGPEHQRLKNLAGPTITFVVGASDAQIAAALAKAHGFFYPQEEDFGITQVEAMAAGCPVIAFAKGGALDVVVAGKTGIFFKEQTVDSLAAAIQDFQKTRFAPKVIQAHAEQFSEERFVQEIRDFVAKKTN